MNTRFEQPSSDSNGSDNVIKTALPEIDPSQTLREIFRARLNYLIGFLQRLDDLKFLTQRFPHRSGIGEPIRIYVSSLNRQSDVE